MELFVWILVWICIGILIWRFGIPLFVYNLCLEWLFGLVVVLNGGKFCIKKMLGFRGDAVHFFKTNVFVLTITWPSLSQIE